MSSQNKGISTPIGIFIIVICVLLVGGILAWQYFGVPKGETKAPETKAPEEIVPKDETTNPSPKCSKDEDCKEGEICVKGACHIKPVKKDETANWKIYRNEELGFEIKYPPKAGELGVIKVEVRKKVDMENNIIDMSFRPFYQFDVEINTEEFLKYYKSSKESLETFLKCYPASSTGAPVKTKKTVKIGDREFCLLTVSEHAMGGIVVEHNCYWTKRNDHYLVLDFNIFSPGDKKLQTIIRQMLSTLRFLE